MTGDHAEDNHEYASELSEELKGLSDRLKDGRQKELLAGILTVAHKLKDGANGTNETNGNGTSDLVSGFRDAFDPLPAKNIQMILKFKSDDNPSMIVYSEPPVAKDEPPKPDEEQPPK